MKRRTTKAKTKREPRPLSRPLLMNMLDDLSKRIDRHIGITESIMEAHKPLGDHIVVEHHVRTVFNVLFNEQLRSLRDIAGLTTILCERGRP